MRHPDAGVIDWVELNNNVGRSAAVAASGQIIGTGMNTEPWKGRRRLITTSTGCFCYCPLSHHPMTGEPIRQMLPCPLEAPGFDLEPPPIEGHAEGTGVLAEQYDPMADPCREYTETEWRAMW